MITTNLKWIFFSIFFFKWIFQNTNTTIHDDPTHKTKSPSTIQYKSPLKLRPNTNLSISFRSNGPELRCQRPTLFFEASRWKRNVGQGPFCAVSTATESSPQPINRGGFRRARWLNCTAAASLWPLDTKRQKLLGYQNTKPLLICHTSIIFPN